MAKIEKGPPLETYGVKLMSALESELSRSQKPTIGQSLCYPRLRELESNDILCPEAQRLDLLGEKSRKFATTYTLSKKGERLLHELRIELRRLSKLVGGIE
jgi:DNA-binding PadR family transcriptional regulator